MPTQVVTNLERAAPGHPPPGYPPRKRWTRSDCKALEATGLWEREKLELIEGDLISKMGKNWPHVNATALVMKWLAAVFGPLHAIQDAPLDVSPEDNPTNEPEPDLMVLKQPCSAYDSANRGPSDVRLLVEISDSTLAFDLGIKARLYARAGIGEYWVVDVAGRRIIVHRSPRAGVYEAVTSYRTGESIEPLFAPGKFFSVDDAFPGLPANDTQSTIS
jgi:Uma2 family endonuclease